MPAQSLRSGSANRAVEGYAFALETAMQNRARWARDPFVGLVGLVNARAWTHPVGGRPCSRCSGLTHD
jgi:hypothetical protein